jgi:hypothetical protein
MRRNHPLHCYQSAPRGAAGWNQFTSVHTMGLSWNSLTSTIPSTWNTSVGSLMAGMKQLLLQSNMLQGTLPASWAGTLNSQGLQCISVQGNPGVCGVVPDGLPCVATAGTLLGALSGSPTCGQCIGVGTGMNTSKQLRRLFGIESAWVVRP